jgi:hypothetical protein
VTQEKLDGEDAKTTNAYIRRTVEEVHRILAPLEPDTRLIVLARVQRDTAERIQEIEEAAAMMRAREERR